MKTRIKKVVKCILIVPLGSIGFSISYFVIAILSSLIPVGNEISLANSVEIFVSSNGLHSDFVVPFNSDVTNWSDFINESDYSVTFSSGPEYISFGWGDKGFYFNTPSWNDLTCSTALNALFGLTETVMHVTLWQNKPIEYTNCIKITLTKDEYQQLVEYISESFAKNNGMPILFDGKAYYNSDNFYLAEGHYTLFYTCNTWVNEGLRKINIKTALWTPFEEGIYYHLRE